MDTQLLTKCWQQDLTGAAITFWDYDSSETVVEPRRKKGNLLNILIRFSISVSFTITA